MLPHPGDARAKAELPTAFAEREAVARGDRDESPAPTRFRRSVFQFRRQACRRRNDLRLAPIVERLKPKPRRCRGRWESLRPGDASVDRRKIRLAPTRAYARCHADARELRGIVEQRASRRRRSRPTPLRAPRVPAHSTAASTGESRRETRRSDCPSSCTAGTHIATTHTAATTARGAMPISLGAISWWQPEYTHLRPERRQETLRLRSA